MNDKILFCLFLKYSEVVISRYKELTSSKVQNLNQDEENRKDFDDVFKSSKEIVDDEIRKITLYGKDYKHPSLYFDYYFRGDGLEKYGIFSYIPLYKQTKWNLDIIEKYKDCIVWPLLFEYGDFMFEEDDMNRYERYIPWIDYSTGSGKFVPFYSDVTKEIHGTTLSNFKNVGFLSDDFIKSHISVIDIWGLCSTAYFILTEELVKLFIENCPYNLIDDYRVCIGGLSRNERVIISSDVLLYIAKTVRLEDWKKLLPKVSLTQESFLEFYLYNSECMKILFKLDFDKRREIVSLIEQHEEIRKLVEPVFIKELWQGGGKEALYSKSRLYFYNHNRFTDTDQWLSERDGFEGLRNLPYTYDFSVELIKQNILSWNKQSYEYFSHMRRTPDTNYHFYYRVTAWDILSKQESILLTYDLCKYLMSIDIVIGGSYVLEDSCYHTDDVPNYSENALKVFSLRDVYDNNEFIKISQDESLVEFFLANAKPISWDKSRYVVNSFIDKLIVNFFKDFSFEKFQDIITHYN